MAAAQGKVIITCAVTGSIHTPTMSPHLPITPDEIAEAAIGAAKAGAAIVHLHPQRERIRRDLRLLVKRAVHHRVRGQAVFMPRYAGLLGRLPVVVQEERMRQADQPLAPFRGGRCDHIVDDGEVNPCRTEGAEEPHVGRLDPSRSPRDDAEPPAGRVARHVEQDIDVVGANSCRGISVSERGKVDQRVGRTADAVANEAPVARRQ